MKSKQGSKDLQTVFKLWVVNCRKFHSWVKVHKCRCKSLDGTCWRKGCFQGNFLFLRDRSRCFRYSPNRRTVLIKILLRISHDLEAILLAQRILKVNFGFRILLLKEQATRCSLWESKVIWCEKNLVHCSTLEFSGKWETERERGRAQGWGRGEREPASMWIYKQARDYAF